MRRYHSLPDSLLPHDDEARECLHAGRAAASSPVESAIALRTGNMNCSPEYFVRVTQEVSNDDILTGKTIEGVDLESRQGILPSREDSVAAGRRGVKVMKRILVAGKKKVSAALSRISGSKQDTERDCSKMHMGMSFTGATGLAFLKLQDTEDKIELSLDPLIFGFGISFGASLLAFLVAKYHCHPTIAVALEMLGTVSLASTFFALVFGV